MTARTGIEPDWTTARLLTWLREHFTARRIEPARLIGEMLLSHTIGCDRMRLYMEPQRPASSDERAALRDLVRRATAGEPVQYLVGWTTFYSRRMQVEPVTQIPQPCTEDLVALTVRHLREADGPGGETLRRRRSEMQERGDGADARGDGPAAPVPPPATAWRLADLGTGTGCVAISLALELPAATVIAVECHPAAADLARRNARDLGVDDRVEVREGSLLDPLAGEAPFDAIVGNLPYIPDDEWEGGLVEAGVQRYVPASALRGGPDGARFIGPVIRGAPALLRPGGLLALELAASRAGQVLALARAVPAFPRAVIERDSEGFERFLVAARGDGSLG
ncbi:MAG: peptide chain release factor N(5)-glutamine methyltransferase [Phycisphaeraceae bacterium]|nr:peptide chain release factor N(5)-glutamine methyltransferase [Phycisphaeraceae bacterium]